MIAYDASQSCEDEDERVGQGRVHSKMADDSAPYVCNLPIVRNSLYLPENALFHLFLWFGSVSRE